MVFKMAELAMTPWLIGFLVLVGILALAWMGGKLVESRSAQWEEDQVRRIAAENADLPDNWRDLDGKGSFDEAWAEMRRKTGGT